MIISLLNQKGGVGKTTLAIHIAAALTEKNMRIILIDADPQKSALDWSAARVGEPLFPVVGMPKENLHKEIPRIANGVDHIIIDGPPRVTALARSVIMASDIVLIPVQPSPYDVWGAEEIVNLIKEASAFKEKMKSAFVINRKITNTAIGRDVSEALAQFGIPVLKTHITQRVVFAESAAAGQTVLEIDQNSASSLEIKQLLKEILSLK